MPFTEDRNTLIAVLTFTETVLEHYISKLQPDDRNRFQVAWSSEVKLQLQEVVAELQRMNTPETETWVRLRRVGLTNNSLVMKRHYLVAAAKGGWRKKFLDLLNKFLGSLAAGIPGAEPIKELKEWLEGLLDDLPEPDVELTNLSNRSDLTNQ